MGSISFLINKYSLFVTWTMPHNFRQQFTINYGVIRITAAPCSSLLSKENLPNLQQGGEDAHVKDLCQKEERKKIMRERDKTLFQIILKLSWLTVIDRKISATKT